MAKKSLLEEYKESNQPVRKSLLQEYVDANGYKGLNEKFAQQELANGGGFGATQAGLKYQSDGSMSYTILPTTVGSKNYYSFLASKGIYNQDVIRSVYGGQSRSDMLKKLSSLDSNSDEYKMLDWYANSDEVMTAKDYRDKIADAQRRLEEAQKNGQSVMDYDPATGGYRIRNTNEADIKAITEEINGYKDSLWRVQNRETYGNLDSNADYAEKSKTIDKKLGTTFGITVFDKYIGTGDEIYAYINDLGGRRTDDEAMRDMGGGTTESMKKYDFMTQKERDNYNYLYQAEGKKSAEKYLDYISYDLDARRLQSVQKQSAQLADDHPVLSSAASVPTNLMSGIGYLDVVRQKAVRDIKEIVTGEYTPINYNSVAMNPSAVTTSIRGTVAQNLANEYGVIEIDEEKHPVMSRIFNGKSLGDVYQLGMSMADSAAIRLLVPFIGPSGTLLLGGSAATQGMLDAVARGANDEQAVTMGFMNGLFETLFEEVSLDKLINGESRSILMSMAKQGFIEGSEEFFTTFANNIADLIVMADKSGIGQNVAQYKALHPDWTEEQCRKQATIDAALDLFWDFTGGVITGGFMGGFESVSRISGQNKSAKQTYNGYDAAYQEALVKYLELTNDPKKAQKLATKDAKKATKSPLNNRNEAVTALVDEALELDPSNELAAKMKSRLESGKSVRGAQIYDLTQANEAAITALDIQTIQDSTEARLMELGEKANVEAIAKALAKEAAGQKLSTAERRAIENSTYGNRVRNELNPVNIESGEYSTAWAERMDTNRINAEEYSRLVEEAQIDPKVVSAAPADNTTDDTTASPAAYEAASALATGNDVVDKVVTKFAEKGEISGNDVRPILSSPEAVAALETAVGALDLKGKTGSEQRAIVRNAIARYVVNSRNTQNTVEDTTNAVDNSVDNTVENASATVETTTQEEKTAPSAEKTAAKTDIKVKRADKATKATGKKRGTVTGLGVKIADMKKAFNDPQGKAYKFLVRFAEATGINIVLYSSKLNSIGQFTQEEGRFSWDEDTIYIDINSGLNTINDVGVLEKYTMLRTFCHEFVHFLEKWNDEEYKSFSDLVVKTMGKKLAEENSDLTVDDLIRRKQEQYQQQFGENFTEDRAKREVVADAMTDILPYSNFMQELATENPNIVEKLISKLKEFIENLKSYYNGITVSSKPEAQLLKEEVNGTVKYAQEILDAFDSLAKGGVENYKQAMESDEVSTKAIPVEDTTQLSMRSLAQAGGFVAVRDEDGNIIVKRDGKKVSEVTTDDIDNSPIGALINYSLEKSYISDADAMAQKKLFADLLTMAAKSNDFAMAMQFAGSSVFTAIKSNSDSQYSTTYDFPSICTKTQAVIDSMSAAMKEKRGGLTKEEIEYIYNKVHNDGNPVPCPECYVFSRWVGIGGLLDNMWTYQNKYAGMTASEVQAEYLAMEERVKKVAEENNLSLGKAKGKLAAKFTKRYNELYERITKAENQGERVSEKDRAELAVLKDNMETVKSMTWIDKVYFKDSSHKTANPKKKWFVDPNVLFDLNEGESFATNYPEAWGFRTTQGAGYGKAITPYAEATLGEGILGTNNINKTVKDKKDEKLENIFLEQSGKLDSKARKVLDKATVKMRNQSFLGGQRFQSTSDARFENALDYLIACLEVQAMGGMVQVYTKVPGAVPAFAAWGFSTNQSLMPKGSGLDANGNPVDTSVGGMDPGVARANRDKFDTQGTITIGVNDNHIIALMDQVWRDFIIPYHASGGDSELIRRFREIQDDGKVEATTSTDYTRTQGDKILSDEVLRNYYKKTDAEIDLIHARRQARLDIFAMNRTDRYKRNPDMEIVRGSKYLMELYNRLSKGGEWEGVFQPKSIIEHQIFPNEFWDQTVSYEESGKITRDYLAYCEELGFLHRFSGMVPSNGTLVKVNGYDENGNRVKLKDLAYKDDGSVRDYFWKTLTDRRMYDNEGKYLPQRRVSLGTTQASDVHEFAGTKKYGKKAGRQYDPDLSAKTAKEVAAKIGSRNQYALREVPPVQPSNDGWKRTKTTAEAMEAFPNMWNVAAEESEKRNPTQIASTVGTYRKIYDILKKEGFSGTILDASSGMGYGTRAGREEYGFDVEDIEPYPDSDYNPMYTDYSTLDKKYDVIISSAVLNVLPQDQRDALVVKMGQLLKDGGRMFITTRGKDVENLAKTGKNIHLGEMEWIETVKGSYQKGFTNPELILYLRDALGPDFTVVPASKETGGKFNNNTNVVVTKKSSKTLSESGKSQYALRDSDGNDLSTAQQEFFKDSEVRDDDGNLLVVYHATDADFNIFQRNKLGKSTLGNASSFDLAATSLVGHWFSDHDTSKQLGTKKVIKAYLNITRPYYTSLDGLAEEIGGYANDYNKAQERFEVSEFGLTRKSASEFVKHLRWEGYDGLIVDDREMGGTSYVVLDSNQVKSIDNKSPSKRKNIQYSLRSSNLSNMDVLLEAAEAVKNGDERYGNLKEGEKTALDIFTKRATALKDLQQRRLDLLAERRDILASKGDRDATSDEKTALRRIQNNLNTTNAQIRKAQDEVIKLENYNVVKKILQQARGIVEKESRQRGIDELKAYKAKRDERDSVLKYRESVSKNVKKLSDMLIKNTDKEHIPEGLKTVVGDFLSTIDFSSKRSMNGGKVTKKDKQFLTTLNRLRGVLQRQAAYMADPENNQGGIDAYLDMPSGFVDEMDRLAQSVEETISGYNPEENHVNLMTGEQLKELNHILKVLHHTISTMNEFHANAHYASVESAARDTIIDTYALGKDSGEMEKLRSFAYWENTLPYYAFKRMGGAAMSIFESLQDGWDKLAVNTKTVLDFSTKAYTSDEATAWASEVHEIELSSGEKVTMTTSQIMSLYCLAKRERARDHLFGGGMRVGNIDIEADPLKKRKKFTKHQTDPFTLTVDDISTITSVLTDKQISVADKLQKYMNTVGTDWGNEVSMRRFGYRAFGEENYFPISSDKTNLPAVDPDKESTDLFRLLNMTMTKSLTDKANNALVVSDIFDVFANHMTDMAKYNALALPVLDAMKWYNYKSTTKNKNGQVKTQTVQRALESAYGKAANTYFINFIKDLNGSYESGRGEGFSSRMVSNYKVAAVGANLRVALLQPTAYVRASAVLNPKVMAKALTMKPAVDEMLKYSGTAVWKSLGFYDTNIGRGVRDQIKNAATLRDKIVEKSMLAAEWADKVTWGVIWNACKIDQQMQGVTEDKLMEATAKRFRDVIYATQVMDSTMTRSHLMRSKSGLVKLTTSFMSEPTMSYNILLDAYSEFSDAKRRGFNAWEKAGKKITVAFAAYAASQVAAAIVESLADALRDDDDYQTFLEKWNEAFFGKEGERMKGNLLLDINPLNKIPILKDVLDFSGYGNTRMDTEWINSIYEAWKVWGDGGKNRHFYGKIYKTLQAASRVIGLPISNALREVSTIWNNTIGSMTGIKLKTYDAGEENNTKYAYQDGYISEEDATSELLSQGLVKDENEAYWTIRSWESEDGSFSRYDRLYETVLAGKDASDAIEELTTHGYKEKEVISTLRGKIGEWYKDEESEVRVSRQEAMSMLVKYCGMSNDEAADKVTTWDYAHLDTDGSGGVSQIEAAEGLQSMDPYKASDVWDAFGWSSSYEEFVSDPKNIAKLDLRAAGLDYDESTWRNAMNESGLSDSAKDNLVTAFGGAALYEPYKAIRDCGFDPNTSMTILDGMDINGNNSVTQEEVYRYISENFDPYTAESIWDAIAKAKGWESKGVTRPYSYAQKKFR